MQISCVTYNLQTVQFTTFYDVFTFHDDSGAVIDISTATFSLYARLTEASTTNLFSIGLGTGLTVTNGPAGILTLNADPAVLGINTIAFNNDLDDRVSIPYWLFMTLSGITYPILMGPLTIARA